MPRRSARLARRSSRPRRTLGAPRDQEKLYLDLALREAAMAQHEAQSGRCKQALVLVGRAEAHVGETIGMMPSNISKPILFVLDRCEANVKGEPAPAPQAKLKWW